MTPTDATVVADVVHEACRTLTACLGRTDGSGAGGQEGEGPDDVDQWGRARRAPKGGDMHRYRMHPPRAACGSPMVSLEAC